MRLLPASLLIATLLLATSCGSPEAPKTVGNDTLARPAPSASAPTTSAAEPASAPAASSAAAPAATTAPAAGAPAGLGLTKAALTEANKIVMAAYPGPFDKTYASVVAKIGEPKKKGDNMFEWFASDGGKCVQFFMTKDAKKGHAASGVSDTDAAACK